LGIQGNLRQMDVLSKKGFFIRKLKFSSSIREETVMAPKKNLVLILSMAALLICLGAGVSSAAYTFFGEDLGLGEGTPLPSHPNADTARNNFIGSLTGVGTETFESYANGTGAPLVITFPGAGTATLNGNGSVANVTPGTTNGVGRYAISGAQYWESSDVFSIDFSAPVAAFGFYGIDIGDFGGQLTLTLALQGGGTTNLTVPNTINGAGGGVLYYGYIDTDHLFTGVTFGNTASGYDYFGFDDMTIGSYGQVGPIVPIPGAVWLLGSGLLGLAGFRKKRK
jgi:hypothetical protein